MYNCHKFSIILTIKLYTMRKCLLSVATIALFLGSFIFSFSYDSNGKFHAFKKAEATGLTYQLNAIKCPGNTFQTIFVCGPGTNTSCTASGSCSN